MARRVSAREARAQFAELTDRVRYTGEPVIVEKQGRPFVAVVSLNDLEAVERLRRERRTDEFSRLAAEAAHQVTEPEPSDAEIVGAAKRTREALYREQYGDG